MAHPTAVEQKIGRVVQVIGPVVDIEFAGGALPDIYNAVRIVSDEADRGTALEVLSAMQQPGADPITLEASSAATVGELVEVSGPGLEYMYLYGNDVPEPASGNAFQLWLGSGGTFTPVGDPFMPEGGLVLLRLTVDPSRYDEVLITEEPLGVAPTEPSTQGGHTWRASI